MEDGELIVLFLVYFYATFWEGFFAGTSFARENFHNRMQEIDSKRASRVNTRVPAWVAAPDSASYSLYPVVYPRCAGAGPGNPGPGALKAGPRRNSVGDEANDGDEIITSIICLAAQVPLIEAMVPKTDGNDWLPASCSTAHRTGPDSICFHMAMWK